MTDRPTDDRHDTTLGKCHRNQEKLGCFRFYKHLEIFLLENQAMADLGENSFVEGIEALHFLSSMRDLLERNLYNIQEVIEASPHESFLLGYKIEKYIDNDVSGPIQTFYTINTKFTDTQLKYGRKYIYKIKALIGVFGTTHRYTGYSNHLASWCIV